MNMKAQLGGGLQVTLHYSGSNADATVHAVRVQSARPLRAAAILAHKPVDEALQLISTLYSICGNAQTCAAVRAIENATGRAVSDEVNVMRQAAVDMETLREHLWRLLLDWPKHLQRPPDHPSLAKVVLLQQRFEHALGYISNWFKPGAVPTAVDSSAALAVVNSLQALIEDAVLNIPCEQWLELNQWQSLNLRAQQPPSVAPSSTRALLQHIDEKGWSAACVSAVRELPVVNDSNAAFLIGRLQHWEFIEQPVWQGAPRETSSLVRNQSPLLTSVSKQYGNGLLTRAIALLNEVVALVTRLQRLFSGQRVNFETYPDLPACSAYALGQVSAARGQLFHWLELDGERVADYRILAPTEWNFHPRGVIAEGLLSLQGSISDLRQQATLLIELVDPCVGYQLGLQGPTVRAGAHYA